MLCVRILAANSQIIRYEPAVSQLTNTHTHRSTSKCVSSVLDSVPADEALPKKRQRKFANDRFKMPKLTEVFNAVVSSFFLSCDWLAD